MNQIILTELKLKTFTEQNAEDYCLLNNLNINSVKFINLGSNNELTDISGIKLFKNLKVLFLHYNNITDISVLKNLIKLRVLTLTDNKLTDISAVKYLNDLEELYIRYLELESNQIQYIKRLKKLKKLYCKNGFKDMSIINQFNKNIEIYN